MFLLQSLIYQIKGIIKYLFKSLSKNWFNALRLTWRLSLAKPLRQDIFVSFPLLSNLAGKSVLVVRRGYAQKLSVNVVKKSSHRSLQCGYPKNTG